MGVYIKGMEMPTNCLECVFYRRADPLYDYCCISTASPKGYVPNDCPLVELSPHGRLIDADALEETLAQKLRDLVEKQIEEEHMRHESEEENAKS